MSNHSNQPTQFISNFTSELPQVKRELEARTLTKLENSKQSHPLSSKLKLVRLLDDGTLETHH